MFPFDLNLATSIFINGTVQHVAKIGAQTVTGGARMPLSNSITEMPNVNAITSS
ncbi:hypothetical protein DAPPUDRAFT_309086 [Daphnia pulex]|uniref:Uncharacterized protein n=1 Tax=Daphnia pulex TaxID=6669 RepID=E9G3P0_DAPPU|nr:hypothetical protein DAPPUDRAFT_309086 [Daphnia pulex]|eukprot:EFX85801.1 hypothetical protein DAPPUDRAFT_309086 [Daphnia pulex]